MKRKIINALVYVVCAFTICACWFALGKRYAENQQNDVPQTEIVTTETVAHTEPTITTIAPEEVTEPLETIEEVYYDCPLDFEFQNYIRKICEANDVPMTLILAMISAESSFRPNIISKTNDYGLMQINVVNHDWLSETYGITDFLDPYQNVFAGIQMYLKYYHKYGEVNMALMAYNHGEAGAKRMWDKGIYETDYTRKVINTKESFDDEI